MSVRISGHKTGFHFCSKCSCLPRLWLVSDARNDAVLAALLARMPRGSGFIYRHYHLPPEERRARFLQLRAAARRRGHTVVLAGSATEARAWGAAGVYGNARSLARGAAMLRLATAHDLGEIGRANRAHAILLSPVFATASHPGARTLGMLAFRTLAARARVPVIAMGGMSYAKARRLCWESWAAIDGWRADGALIASASPPLQRRGSRGGVFASAA